LNPLRRHTIKGTAIPVRGNDIDTDRILPARFLTEITFDRMDEFLFYDARFDSNGEEKDHPINNPHYVGATVMIVENNFGCGSSREHAPQAIMRHGIQAIIGESFAEIFAGNCKAIGVPTVTVSKEVIQALLNYVELHPQKEFTLNIDTQKLSYNSCDYPIFLAPEKRQLFLEGTWDEVSQLADNLPKVKETAANLPYFNQYE